METDEQDKELAEIMAKAMYADLSAEEAEKLSLYLSVAEADPEKKTSVISPEKLKEMMASYARLEENKTKNLRTVLEAVNKPTGKGTAFSWPLIGWAAAILVILSGAGIFFLTHYKNQDGLIQSAVETAAENDIDPGSEGAVLTLADGTDILLDNLKGKTVADQPGARAILRDGTLIYDITGGGDAPDMPVFNTLTVPKGRQFKMVLSDGTKIWLNAASSIRYPIVFNSRQRTVTIEGEAYFEIAADKQRPFIAAVSGEAEVEALGTSFNVKAYGDESISKITLLEGTVRVHVKDRKTGSEAGKAVVLSPGQQAQVTRMKNSPGSVPEISTMPADMNKVMAWKSGFFNFDGAGLEEVMRQLARWYNLEVVYETGVPPIVFEGELSRNIPLSSVLAALKDYDVNFRLEGRKIIVQP